MNYDKTNSKMQKRLNWFDVVIVVINVVVDHESRAGFLSGCHSLRFTDISDLIVDADLVAVNERLDVWTHITRAGQVGEVRRTIVSAHRLFADRGRIMP